MATGLDALIAIQGKSGESRVDHAELAAQLQALHPRCFGWAMACCDNRREDAEDVLQDIYAGVLYDGLRFDGLSSFRTWLFGVIRRKATARLRRERLRALLGVRHAERIDAPAPATLPDDGAVASERRDRTRRALGTLARRQREVLLLVFYHDLTIEEASKVMRVTLGSARVHYDRGKKRLALLLQDQRP